MRRAFSSNIFTTRSSFWFGIRFYACFVAHPTFWPNSFLLFLVSRYTFWALLRCIVSSYRGQRLGHCWDNRLWTLRSVWDFIYCSCSIEAFYIVPLGSHSCFAGYRDCSGFSIFLSIWPSQQRDCLGWQKYIQINLQHINPGFWSLWSTEYNWVFQILSTQLTLTPT